MRNLKRITRNKDIDRDEIAGDFLQNVKEQLETDDVAVAVSFIKHADGSIYYVTTESNTDELIGIVEIGKNELLNN